MSNIMNPILVYTHMEKSIKILHGDTCSSWIAETFCEKSLCLIACSPPSPKRSSLPRPASLEQFLRAVWGLQSSFCRQIKCNSQPLHCAFFKLKVLQWPWRTHSGRLSFTWTLGRTGVFVAAEALVPICLLRKSRETWVSLSWFLDLSHWVMILSFIWCCTADICPLPVERYWWIFPVETGGGGAAGSKLPGNTYPGERYWGDRLDWKISEFSQL